MEKDDVNKSDTAYDPIYFRDFRKTLAEMFDLALNVLDIEPAKWQAIFCSSEMARQIEADGNPYYLSNRSSYDFLREVLNDYSIRYSREPWLTEAYWAGWITATAQYRHPDLKFAEVYRNIPLARLLELYYPLHEEGETRAIDFLLDDRNRIEANAANKNGRNST